MKILICGAGAIGSNLTACLAADLRGEHELTVLDFDTVEERNIRAGTQFYTREQLDWLKVEALQYNIYKAYERGLNTIDSKLSSDNVELLKPYDLIIDCFDNQLARGLSQLAFNFKNDRAVLHIGFSNIFTFAIEWAENYQVPTDILSGFDICETRGASSFVKMVAALSSSVIQEFIANSNKREYVGNAFTVREIT